MRQGFVAAFLLPLLLLTGQGCAPLATYGQERVRDLSDVVDLCYGVGFGLGASVQFGETFQTSLGCAREMYQREWFGRKSVETRDGFFAGGLLYGVDGDGGKSGPRHGYGRCCCCEGDADGARGNTTGGEHLLILGGGGGSRKRTGDEAWFTEPGGRMPILDELRIGGAVFLPGVLGGAYLNVGEAIDFLCGLVTYDAMNDDGYPKFFTPEAPEGLSVPEPPPQQDTTGSSARDSMASQAHG